MGTKTTAKTENIRETLTFTEEEVIAALAEKYNLPMKGPLQFDCDVQISNNILREIVFSRKMIAEPLVNVVEI